MNRESNLSRAFWLAIVCFNLYLITRSAFQQSPHTFGQTVYFILLGLWIRLTYREIRKAMKGER